MWVSEEKFYTLQNIIYKGLNNRYRSTLMDVDYVSTKSSLDHRRRLRQFLTHLFHASDCKVFSSKYLQNIKVPPVNSASDSIMVIADLNINDMVAYGKLTPCTDCTYREGLHMLTNIIFKITFKTHLNQYEVENGIYKLLSKYELPFVMQHLHTFHCTNFLQYIHQPDIVKRLQALQKQHGHKYDWNQSQIIMCERGSGHSLFESIEKNIVDSQDLEFVFLEVIFCLGFFEDIGIVHHDLHLGNVWLDHSDKIFKYRLFIHKTLPPIEFVTNILVKVYDFDHSTVTQTPYNSSIVQGQVVNRMLDENGLCAAIGECNKYAYGRDYFQFAWWLYNRTQLPEKIKAMIERSVDNSFLRNKRGNYIGSLAWDGHPCVIKDRESCQMYPQMPSINKLLRGCTGTEFNGNSTYDIMQEVYLPSYNGEEMDTSI